ADDDKGVAWQLQTLERVAGDESLPRSLANSAAILRHPETHADWVRPGIMLYGCSPFPDSTGADIGLKPAMTLASELISIRELAAGDAVGYGGVFVAEQPIRIGVVACGYADGYPRHAPTGSPVLVGGTLTRTIGRVSMDMLSVDVTGIGDARVGTRVVLWGEGNPVERVAHAAGTVGYELLCAVAPRVRIIEKP
ncbi:MAG: alanine racemase, partial [Burkholderiales bacterium]